MLDTLASEWDKTRSARSTHRVLAVVAAFVPAAALFALLGNSVWDALPAERMDTFGAVPPERYLLPMVQLCLGVYGTLAITSEYATGTIGTSVVATPRRLRLFAAKAAVVGGFSLLVGTAFVLAAFLVTRLLVGDRPIPNHNAPFTDEAPMLFAMGLSVAAVALLGLGMGTVLRSTAGPIVVLSALLFVAPLFAQFLPETWVEEAASVMLPSLPGQLAAVAPEGRFPTVGPYADVGVLSPLSAAAVPAGYVVLAIGAAAPAISWRDI